MKKNQNLGKKRRQTPPNAVLQQLYNNNRHQKRTPHNYLPTKLLEAVTLVPDVKNQSKLCLFARLFVPSQSNKKRGI